MKTIIGAAALAVCASAEVNPQVIERDVGPDVFRPGQLMQCAGEEVEYETLDRCGSSPETPCKARVEGSCGECFKIEYSPAEDQNEAICKGEGCGGYTAVAYVKSTDSTGTGFNVDQNAWGVLCPLGCNGSEQCVQRDDGQCVYGTTITMEAFDMRGAMFMYNTAAHMSRREMKVTPYECLENALDGRSMAKETKPAPKDAMASCLPLHGSHTMSCRQIEVTEDNSGVQCGSETNPCLAVADFYDPIACVDQCYKVTYEQAAEEAGVSCGEAGCPALSSSVFVHVVDKNWDDRVEIGIAQGGWTALCPEMCRGSGNICVKDDFTVCNHGLELQIPGAVTPSTCAIEGLRVKYEKVSCPEEKSAPAPGILPGEDSESKAPRAASAAKETVVGCANLEAPHAMGCRQTQVTPENTLNCGDIQHPCIAVGDLYHPIMCDFECYKVSSDLGEAFVKVMDGNYYSEVDMQVSQGAFRKLCPFLCKGGNKTCVADAAECGEYGVEESTTTGVPGSCAMHGGMAMKVEPIECHTGPVDAPIV